MRPQAWALSHGSGVQEGDKDKAVLKNVSFLSPLFFPRAGVIGAVPSTVA